MQQGVAGENNQRQQSRSISIGGMPGCHLSFFDKM
jgi:hypothetical protein